MPYLYSLAGQTYLNDYTIMRGMVMDFPADENVLDIKDQYMFGPSLLINPVTDYRARNRNVYLPTGCGWYDFFTGKYYDGGQYITADAPYSRIPVFVRAGSIIPTGPEIQYTSEKHADPVTLLVYEGADGSFSLYEDEGINYNYEKGAFSQIKFSYNEAEHTLVIAAREGVFPGMVQNRTFKIVVTSKEKAVKLDFDAAAEKYIQYDGKEVTVQL